MNLGFYIIMAAQFFSALADNALLIAAIAMLRDMQAPDSYAPLLKTFFTVSYVALAAFVGAFADSMPKWRVMFISNTIKIGGCMLMFFGVHPLVAYAVVGLGAAAYSPAKYGILTEYLPPRLLVVANGWIEGLTVGAIILGTVLGGILIKPDFADALLSINIPFIDTGIDTMAEMNLVIIGFLYLIASVFNLYIPDTGVDHVPLKKNPMYLLHEFTHCVKLLWRDKLGQISLAVTTLFWGAGATLQFIVIEWARAALDMDLAHASMLQGVVAIGVAVGAIMAAKMISLRKSIRVIPLGIYMGFGIIVMTLVPFIPELTIINREFMVFGREVRILLDLQVSISFILLIIVGALSGFFVVPMNALLQHRGHVLMGAGHSIAVQNFNENLSILIVTTIYALLIRAQLHIYWIIILFGLCVAGLMILIKKRHEMNQREHDDVALLEDTTGH
ncbi:MAG TPA: lysophospholipid transporter LplT [Rhodocyclaceae bacterium]|jgi:MFS family permease|nr:lysophospholipid transporter LplT [Rhodocyclaceae bacterium]